MTMTQFKVLERNYPRVDAYDKVTGRATYASDVYLPGMLAGKLLPSTRNHARIVSIDTSKAAALPGVRCVITGTDFPDLRYGSGALRDRYIMPREVVNFVGEPIAAVAADDEATAQEAIALIEVEYEDLPSVVNPLAAMGDGAATVHPELENYEGYGFTLGHNVSTLLDADRGDVEQAFQDADVVVEDVYRSQGINQGFLEPMACVADVEPNGRLVIYASTQGPYQIRAGLASVLEIPVSRIRVVAMELGGGFGAKLRLTFEAFPALLAMKTGRPVKLVNTREEVFTMNGPRLPVTNYIRSGVMRDGTITAREAYTIFDVGAYLGAGPNSGIGHGIGAYRVPNYRLRSYGVYTNKIYVGSYRASGVADMTFAVESHMDHIAHELGIDPYDLRVKNALREGDVSVSGAVVPSNGLMETLAAIKEKMDWPRQLEDGHGLGLALCEWRSGSGPLHGGHQRERRRYGEPAHRVNGHIRQRYVAGGYCGGGSGHRHGAGYRRQAGHRPGALHGPVGGQPHRVQPGNGGETGGRRHGGQADGAGRRAAGRAAGRAGLRRRAGVRAGQCAARADLRTVGRGQHHLARGPNHRHGVAFQYALHPGIRGAGGGGEG